MGKMSAHTKRQVIFTIGIILFLVVGTSLAVLYGRGYRIGVENGKPELAKTGILSVKSFPEGAQVEVNGHLTAATNENINLTPGEYDVKIYKDGYFPWQKRVKIEEEVVTSAHASLYPIGPKLESITTLGVQNPILDPTRSRIAYTVASHSAKKNGIYVFDMAANPVLSLQGASRQIADDTAEMLSQASLSWSPDGEFLLAAVQTELGTTTYQLRAREFNDEPRDVSATLESILARWEADQKEKDAGRIASLRRPVQKLLKDNFRIIDWSPNDEKILYQATRTTTLPLIIEPRLIGIDKQHEVRDIQKDSVYVYDWRNDVNTKLLDGLPEDCNLLAGCEAPIQWLPDSHHLTHINDKRIDILEYDGTNRTTVYALPFMESYVFAWPNGSQIVILTNLNNPNINPNLYTVSLK